MFKILRRESFHHMRKVKNKERYYKLKIGRETQILGAYTIPSSLCLGLNVESEN